MPMQDHETDRIPTAGRELAITFLGNGSLHFTHARAEEIAGENNAVAVLTEAEVVVPLAAMVDRDAELERLNKEIAEVAADAARLEKMLADPQFTGKAPEKVVAKQRENLAQRQDKLARLKQQLARFA